MANHDQQHPQWVHARDGSHADITSPVVLLMCRPELSSNQTAIENWIRKKLNHLAKETGTPTEEILQQRFIQYIDICSNLPYCSHRHNSCECGAGNVERLRQGIDGGHVKKVVRMAGKAFWNNKFREWGMLNDPRYVERIGGRSCDLTEKNVGTVTFNEIVEIIKNHQ